MHRKSIPGWTLNIDKISNDLFKVTLTDTFGRKVKVLDNATEKTIEKALSDAFAIEKKVSKNWNLFLFNLCFQKLEKTEIKIHEYNDKVYGSWFIQRKDKRLVYDGKDSCLIFQTKSKGNWMDIETIIKDDLRYSNYVSQINKLKENTPHKSFLSKPWQMWWQKLLSFE